MVEYVMRLLRAQEQLAAQFDPARQPEVREASLPVAAVRQEDVREDEAEKKGQTKNAAEEQTVNLQESSVEDTLREASRQAMRVEGLSAQKTAQEQVMRTRELERAMTALFERQTVRLTEKTADAEGGGLIGSARSKMELAGIASSPSQRSMMEISRYFERDARRYG